MKKAYTVIVSGEFIPTALRRLGHEDLAKQAEELPDLEHREVHLDIGWVNGKPTLLEHLGI